MDGPSSTPVGDSGFLFASEAVTEGHPDKLCDRLADAVLDACLAQDSDARVSCGACTTSGMVCVLGDVVARAAINYEQALRDAVRAVGYDSECKGMDWRTTNVIVAVEEQSADLSQAFAAARPADEVGAADGGVVFGYATSETAECMPMSHVLATGLCARLDELRQNGTLPSVCPDARAQVKLQYDVAEDGALQVLRIHTVTLLVRRTPDAKSEEVESEVLEKVVMEALPSQLCDEKTEIRVMVSTKHASQGASGFAGRRTAVDTYGGWGQQGEALAGNDGLRVARCGAYGARWAARSLVQGGFCSRCSVQLSYTPGAATADSVSVHVDSLGSARGGRSDADLANVLRQSFDFRPGCLQRDLGLKTFRFQQLSAHGHFGRPDLKLPWESPKDLKDFTTG